MSRYSFHGFILLLTLAVSATAAERNITRYDTNNQPAAHGQLIHLGT